MTCTAFQKLALRPSSGDFKELHILKENLSVLAYFPYFEKKKVGL
jgi:hypothetical protein